jgi:DNA-binding LytR/AlgR family response regulator
MRGCGPDNMCIPMTKQLLSNITFMLLEDDPVIASMMEDYIIEMGGMVAASFQRLADAHEFVSEDMPQIDVAILDLSVDGDYSTGLARDLVDLDVPVVFCTGYDVMSIPARWRETPRLSKPFSANDIATVSLRALELST